MPSLLPNKRLNTLQINDQVHSAMPDETVLQAALRSGVEMPNSCRVGGCGACKCKLTQGKVKELTETGYLLTAEEIDQGYILACQSVPRSDVVIEVDLSRVAKSVSGRVIAQSKLTHDITRLEIALDQPLAYKAGQFGQLSFDGLPGVSRSYSFATPATPSSPVVFFVRKVPGGQLSSFIHDRDLVGQTATVAGPMGDFWLRPSDAPLLLIAGGSGLAPILALLEDALRAGVSRSVTLLFGAREQRDLYALDEIEAIARQWKGAFRFVPVLSHAADDNSWQGQRGYVTAQIPGRLEPGAEAYLCGPPVMVDEAIDVLERLGVRRDHMYFDRFSTQADLEASASKSKHDNTELHTQEESSSLVIAVLHYLKYFAFHLVGLFSAVAILAGGRYTTGGLLSVLTAYILGDALCGDDRSTPKFKHPWVLTVQLWLALPLLALIVFSAVWSVSSSDVLGFGAWISSTLGTDLIEARAATGLGHHISGWILTGLMIGMVGTIPAHELTHRTWDPISMLVGRWLLAFSFDTSFSIEHVYGHHRYVSTLEDPATAPRGRNVYFHVIASTLKGNLSAWNIEAERLRKKRLAVFSPSNAVLRGYAMSAALVGIAALVGGWVGAAFFTLCALWGKALLEIVNYMEHYGMVRNPATPVQPRHSWNTNRRVSSWTMFNLTRHSHHHAQGEVAYQDLKPYADAPMMINGYLTTLLVAMIPPLWHKLMTPKVIAWDRDYASNEELVLAAAANARSGMPALMSQRASSSADRRPVKLGTRAA